MPMEIERYPRSWKAIALAKKESVGWICEVCGKQCRKPGEPFDTHKRTLTVAHLNHTPEDCRPENLKAMCAVCHLRYDAKHHAETRRKRKEGEVGMIYRDGYSIEQGRNKIIIGLPQTVHTLMDTVSAVSGRKEWLTDNEQAVLLGIVIKMLEGDNA